MSNILEIEVNELIKNTFKPGSSIKLQLITVVDLKLDNSKNKEDHCIFRDKNEQIRNYKSKETETISILKTYER